MLHCVNNLCRVSSCRRIFQVKKLATRSFSASSKDIFLRNGAEKNGERKREHQRIWKADIASRGSVWKKSIRETESMNKSFNESLERISKQEGEGGRMRTRQLGVLHKDPVEDTRLLVQNYTIPSLVSALRDREEVLQLCATLLAQNNIPLLRESLHPFERENVKLRRERKNIMDLSPGFQQCTLEMVRKGLMRMPRRVTQGYQKRAGVVLSLCNVHDVPCVLFEKRSPHLRAHPDEVCLPGGMVCTINDKTIISTCLREMSEEIEGIDEKEVAVLGVLRCNWGEVAQLTGIAVTPGNNYLSPNKDEVAECFTVPLETLLERMHWIHKENSAPIFTGGPHMIWGLTGYILDRFIKDVLCRFKIVF